MPWHTPERKCEQAIKDYLQAVLGYELDGWQIATRFSNADLTEPRIEIFSTSSEIGEPDASPYTGNWLVTCMIKMVSHYAPGVDAEAHDEVVGYVIDNLLVVNGGLDALAAQINATQSGADLEVIQVNLGGRTCSVEEHSLITEQELVLYVKPS